MSTSSADRARWLAIVVSIVPQHYFNAAYRAGVGITKRVNVRTIGEELSRSGAAYKSTNNPVQTEYEIDAMVRS